MLRFALRVARKPAVTSFAVRDAEGTRLGITAEKPDVVSTSYEHDLPTGSSPVYEVVDRAAELVLLDGDREVRRIPLNLLVDQLNQIDL